MDRFLGFKTEEILTCLLLVVVGYFIAKMFSERCGCNGFSIGGYKLYDSSPCDINDPDNDECTASSDSQYNYPCPGSVGSHCYILESGGKWADPAPDNCNEPTYSLPRGRKRRCIISAPTPTPPTGPPGPPAPTPAPVACNSHESYVTAKNNMISNCRDQWSCEDNGPNTDCKTAFNSLYTNCKSYIDVNEKSVTKDRYTTMDVACLAKLPAPTPTPPTGPPAPPAPSCTDLEEYHNLFDAAVSACHPSPGISTIGMFGCDNAPGQPESCIDKYSTFYTTCEDYITNSNFLTPAYQDNLSSALQVCEDNQVPPTEPPAPPVTLPVTPPVTPPTDTCSKGVFEDWTRSVIDNCDSDSNSCDLGCQVAFNEHYTDCISRIRKEGASAVKHYEEMYQNCNPH